MDWRPPEELYLSIRFHTGFTERLLAGVISVYSSRRVLFQLREFQVEPYSAEREISPAELDQLESILLSDSLHTLPELIPQSISITDLGSFDLTLLGLDHKIDVARPIDLDVLDPTERFLIDLTDRLIEAAHSLR